MVIRQEMERDYEKTEQIVKLAFQHEEYSDKKEHDLVSRIRRSAEFVPELSLVTDLDGIIGHILLSKIVITDGDKSTDSLALAPVSVLPEYQGRYRQQSDCRGFTKSEAARLSVCYCVGS